MRHGDFSAGQRDDEHHRVLALLGALGQDISQLAPLQLCEHLGLGHVTVLIPDGPFLSIPHRFARHHKVPFVVTHLKERGIA